MFIQARGKMRQNRRIIGVGRLLRETFVYVIFFCEYCTTMVYRTLHRSNTTAMLQVLICTHNEGILEVPSILLPEAEGIGYVVSMQYSDFQYLRLIPSILCRRRDVLLHTLEGSGLSANRNHALELASADVCVIADDDVRYTLDELRRIEAEHAAHPEADVLLFQARGPKGELLKNYPQHAFDYGRQPKGYYPSSIEITFKRERAKDVPFDLRFGMGSGLFVSGEEEVWLNTLYRKHQRTIRYIPFPIVQTLDTPQGGRNFATRPERQQAKGATLYYIHGLSAWLRCLKEAWTATRRVKGASFVAAFRNTIKGIMFIMKTGR